MRNRVSTSAMNGRASSGRLRARASASWLPLCIAVAALLTASCDHSDGGFGVTTTTVAAPSTTVLGDTTTTSTIDGIEFCVATWRVTNAVTLGALQFETLYANAPGEIAGSNDHVECTGLTGSLSSFNDDDDARKLTAGFISLAGFDGPRDVMHCNVARAGERATLPSDFTVNVIDATDPAIMPVTADVVVSKVDCTRSGVTSTTNSTVTTTSTTVTTNTVTTTTTTLGPGTFVEFSITDPVTIGALQFAVDYSQAAGEFEGTGSTVQCTDHTGSLTSYNDVDAGRQLNVGLVNIAGFTAPRSLVTCSFLPSGAVHASDFAVTVIDAAQPNLNPITPFPTIAVTVVDNGS